MAKILLVEDDNNLREIYEARLQAEGYEIVSARDGEEALTVAMKERPDLIISDVMMPKISGFDMLDIIRSTEETKYVKVIMMTALSQAEDKDRATKLGADRYLVKSQVTLEDVAKVAREVLDGASDQNEPSTPAIAPPTVTQTPTVEAPVTPAPVVEAPEPATAPVVVAPEAVPVATPEPVPVAVAVPAPLTSSTDDTPTTTPVVITPTADTTASAALAAISPAPVADDTTSPAPVSETEESAIAAQIESFIEVKKNEPEVATTEVPETANEPEVVPEPVQEPEKAEIVTDASEKKGKIVIQPISDPTESKGPDLNNLLKKEVEKDQMAEIAKTLASQNAGVVDELTAEAALRSAARAPHNDVKEEIDDTAPQVDITENGDLKVQSEAEAPTVVEPALPPIDTSDVPVVDVASSVITPTNGNNLDGVIAQTNTATPSTIVTEPTKTPIESPDTAVKDDPNAIAL